MSQDINTLREQLFATLQGVKDGTIDVEKAKTISEIGQVLINSAKVEVDFVRANGGGKSSFFREVQGVSHNGSVTQVGNVTTHRLRG